MKNAYITIESGILPVRVDFPHNVGHYRTLAHAMVDIRLFGCRPVWT